MKLLQNVANWFKSPATPQRRSFPSREEIRAYVDSAWTTNQDAEHWGFATSGDANVVYNRDRRRTTRLRARYETTNNAVLRGFVDLRTDDTIGDGPTLQMLEDAHEEIESEWSAWAQEVNLAVLLSTVWDSKMVDGEGIGIMYGAPNLDSIVKLNLLPIEAEQMGNPFMSADTLERYDGIEHFRGIPRSYYIYDYHPDTVRAVPATYTGEWYEPWRICHLMKRRRPGQLRGLSDLNTALPLSAIHRRYTLATLGAAEAAASLSFWLESDANAVDDPNLEVGTPFEVVPFARNQVTTMPYGYKMNQTKGDQPVTGYDLFDRAITIQMGRALKLPAALAHSSAEHNMASGRLEFQTYIRGVNADRRNQLERECLEKLFLVWMQLYLAERAGVRPSDVDTAFIRSEYPHRWSWRPINHSDPEKQAGATVKLLEAGLISDEDFQYERNVRPRDHRKSMERSIKARRELKLPIPGVQPGMQGLTEGNTNGSQQGSATQTET